jgi:hypothetical protein
MNETVVVLLMILCLIAVRAGAELPEVADLPVVEGLPDPFMMNDGSRVASREDWGRRRAEIAEMIQFYEYGHIPPPPGNVEVDKMRSLLTLDGAARLYRGEIVLGPEHKLRARVSFYVPEGKPGPFPVVLNMSQVSGRGMRRIAQRYIERGYILAGFERHDFDQESADRSDGVHPLYPDYDMATVAAWAWGAQRVVDYLLTRDDVNPACIAITGHSRAGKAALFAGALDERITLVAPAGSGAGGAGSYRILGNLEKESESESLDAITDPERWHYWFHPRLRTFAGKEERLPFDQHFVKALVAPRALLALEGLSDFWANPFGTQQTTVAVQPVFDFLGASKKNGMFYRPGGHNMSGLDWMALLDYADLQFFGKPTTREFYRLPFPEAERPFSWTAPDTR